VDLSTSAEPLAGSLLISESCFTLTLSLPIGGYKETQGCSGDWIKRCLIRRCGFQLGMARDAPNSDSWGPVEHGANWRSAFDYHGNSCCFAQPGNRRGFEPLKIDCLRDFDQSGAYLVAPCSFTGAGSDSVIGTIPARACTADAVMSDPLCLSAMRSTQDVGHRT
jgi:hypothetical protein